MNDNDIIKALEYCEKRYPCTNFCPMFYNGTATKSDCRRMLHENALDLINRQKTEIEKLRKENTELKDGYFQKRNEEIEHQELMCLRKAWRKSTDQNMDLQLENERLQAENEEQDQAIINALHRMGQIRAEAIKEFAERLKENISNMEYTADVKRKTVPIETMFTQVNWVFHEIVPETIDKLVKEMTEVRHAETD